MKNIYTKIDEVVIEETLQNGLKIYFMPKEKHFKSYAFFAVRYGGCDRRFEVNGQWHDTYAGIAHFLEHKMFDTPEGNALTTLSANGASPNAFTSSEITAYYFQSTENFMTNLKTLLSFVSVPYFTDESVKKEQGIIGQEIQMIEDDPDHKVYLNLMSALYKERPVRESIAGTVDSISNISADDLYFCHNTFYCPSNMVLCVSGNQAMEDILFTADSILPKAPGYAIKRDYGGEEPSTPVQSKIEAYMEVSVPLFMMGAKIEPVNPGKLRQQLVAELALEMLLGESSELYAKLYEDGYINYSFYYGLETFPDGSFIAIGGESKDPMAVFQNIIESADNWKLTSDREILFEQIRKAAIGSRLRQLDFMEHLCYSRANGYFHKYDPFDAFDLIWDISLDEISEFIKTYFHFTRQAISIVWPDVKQGAV